MTHAAIAFNSVFSELCSSRTLSRASARAAFDAILAGAWTPVQISGLLCGLRLLPDSPTIIAAAVDSMRAAMVPVNHGLPKLLDTCGTGGDGQSTLNISTGAALLVAAAGVPVAKHGNRAVSSRSGSADLLESLGLPLDLSAEAGAELLNEIGITFLMAPLHHPAMRFAAPVRRELGVRTVFNCLGPLANPARATHQLVGAFSDEIRPILAQALHELGTQVAWVVHSRDGLDELSPFDVTRVTVLENGVLSERTVSPEDFGLKRSPVGAISGGDAGANARVFERILAGEAHPAVDAFILNAAAALVVAEGVSPLDAAARIREVLASGTAARKLEDWLAAARRRGPAKAAT